MGNALAMAMFCRPLVEKKLFADAYDMGLAAVEAAPDDMEVRDLVASALGGRVLHWHIPMLRDEARNSAYSSAIRKAVQPGITVLEIGTGAGFLALTAAAAGARVYTCEADPLVAAAAARTVERNGLGERVTVIAKRSTDVEVGHDIPEPADMLVSELFDDHLYGENIVSIIADAKARLLRPDAYVLPPRAELRYALMAYDLPEERQPLDRVGGFDLSAFNVLAPRLSSVLRCPRRAQRLSEAAPALAADFASAAPFGERETKLKLVSTGGRVGAVVQWLRIDFGDGIIFENDPFEGSSSHWGSPVHPLTAPIDTAAGDVVSVTVRRVLENQILVKAAISDD